MAKHYKKGDVWEVLNDRVLNVSNFLSQDPDGELAILTFAGRMPPPSTWSIRLMLSRSTHPMHSSASLAVQGQEGEGSWEADSCCDK